MTDVVPTGAATRSGRHDDRRTALPRTPEPQTGFRPDVEGLRAVAVGAVLLYHSGAPLARGGYVGVDVFFVISGYLITGLLVRELAATGSISIAGFYARRVRRLLPLAMVVLATVTLLSSVLLSPVRRLQVVGDVVASGLCVVNWRLGSQAVDYFGPGGDSPLQHFWSLAVEEQFYLAWPALLLAVSWWSARSRHALTPDLLRAVVAVGAVSFAYCLYATYVGTEDAYFSTFTRAWELALGAGLALVLGARRLSAVLPEQSTAVLAWGGLAAIGWAVVTFDEMTRFPGAAALLPTLGTAVVIAVGDTTSATGPGRLLTWGPARHVGRISYAWYLWHWPALVLAAEVWGPLSTAQGLGVAAASWVPAVVTHHVVERPCRRSHVLGRRPGTALRLGGLCMVTSVLLGCALQVSTPRIPTAPKSQVSGAEAVRRGHDHQQTATAIRPEPAAAAEDRSRMYSAGCLVMPKDTRSPACEFGDTASDTTVVMFGDSHMMQYFPAVDAVAKERGWRLVGLTKSGCPASMVQVYNRGLQRQYVECDEWRDHALRRIVHEEPVMIVTGQLSVYPLMHDGVRLGGDASAQALQRGYEETLHRLRDTGAKVVVVRDSPRRLDDVPGCVSEHLQNLDRCAAPAARALAPTALNVRAAREVAGAGLLDPTPLICPDDTCPAVVGNALVYRDDGHLTATYARTLAPWFAQHLPRAG